MKVGGGVLAQFASGRVYLSPDGMNLAGGGHTIAVPSWDASPANAPFPARDSAHGAQFLGQLWVSGGFSDPTNSDSCFATCSFFDLWSSTDADGRELEHHAFICDRHGSPIHATLAQWSTTA